MQLGEFPTNYETWLWERNLKTISQVQKEVGDKIYNIHEEVKIWKEELKDDYNNGLTT
jgi:hypothetical protein